MRYAGDRAYNAKLARCACKVNMDLMRRLPKLLVYAVLLSSVGCADEGFEPATVTVCSVTNAIESKEVATEQVTGTWTWAKTTYVNRLSGENAETPASTGKHITYTFREDRLTIAENSDVPDEFRYEIKYWAEGSASVDEDVLTLHTFDPASGNLAGASILQLDPSFNCLTLVNSYDDAGGDLTFRRAD